MSLGANLYPFRFIMIVVYPGVIFEAITYALVFLLPTVLVCCNRQAKYILVVVLFGVKAFVSGAAIANLVLIIQAYLFRWGQIVFIIGFILYHLLFVRLSNHNNNNLNVFLFQQSSYL